MSFYCCFCEFITLHIRLCLCLSLYALVHALTRVIQWQSMLCLRLLSLFGKAVFCLRLWWLWGFSCVCVCARVCVCMCWCWLSYVTFFLSHSCFLSVWLQTSQISPKLSYTFTCMHLADTFLQSDLQFIQAMHFLYVCSLGIEPTTFCTANAMLYHWATWTLCKYTHIW